MPEKKPAHRIPQSPEKWIDVYRYEPKIDLVVDGLPISSGSPVIGPGTSAPGYIGGAKIGYLPFVPSKAE